MGGLPRHFGGSGVFCKSWERGRGGGGGVVGLFWWESKGGGGWELGRKLDVFRWEWQGACGNLGEVSGKDWVFFPDSSISVGYISGGGLVKLGLFLIKKRGICLHIPTARALG